MQIRDHSGDIDVTTGTRSGLTDYGINLVAGRRTDAISASSSYYSFAAIGHRGHSNGSGGGDLSGDISVIAERGGLSMKGGENAGTGDVRLHAAQIGHGGYNSDGLKTGSIKVSVDEDIVLENASARQSPVQIGHGGYSHNGNISGWIEVTSQSGSISLDSTVGTRDIANTQIGHGGAATSGTMDGAISVSALQDITVKGGSADATHALIGHGGDSSSGTFSGDMAVLAGGNLSVSGGTHADAYAMVGHGSARSASSGARSGAVKIGVGGATTLTDNTGFARLGHGTTTADAVSGSDFVLATGSLDTINNALGVSGITDVMIEGGNVSFAVLGGNLNIDGAGAFYDNSNIASFVAAGDVNVLSSMQNAGTGAINVAGGWSSLVGINPVTNEFDGSNGLTLDIDFSNGLKLETLDFDFATVNGSQALWGAGGSTVTIGNPVQAAAIGSRSGSTTVLADAVSVQAGAGAGDHAQIGFAPTVNGQIVDGAIMIGLKDGDLNVNAGGQTDGYAQIGHGGANVTSSSLTGALMIDFNADSDATTGDLTMTGGDGEGAYSQLGHGGSGHVGAKNADIAISASEITLNGGNGSGAYSQIGNGGRRSIGNISGDVSVTSTSTDTANDDIILTGGSGTGSYAQIGNGGAESGALSSVGGNVTVATDGGDVNVIAGSGVGASAQIGLGGEKSRGVLGAAGQLTRVIAGGEINVDASAATTLTFAQIGNGGRDAGGSNQGDTEVISGGDINLIGGTGLFSYAQIGLGGAGADGVKSGDISLISGDDLNLTRGSGDSAYTKIGHGDQLFSQPINFGGTGTSSGDISVAVADSIGSVGGMIGHVDPALGGATPGTGNTTIAVSRYDDPAVTDLTHGPGTGEGESNRDPDTGSGLESMAPDDGGNLVADIDSVFSSDPNGELRFYTPTRSDNQIAAGAMLNGVAYAGTPVDPTTQQADEWVVVRYDPGSDVPIFEAQHDNSGGSGAGYDPTTGANFYYDAIVGREQGYVAPPSVGGGGAAGGNHGGGEVIELPGFGGGTPGLPAPLVVPVDPFLMFIDGVPFFGSNRLFEGSPRTFVGFFLFGLLDDRFSSEDIHDDGDTLDEDEKDKERAMGRGPNFDIEYRKGDNSSGTSSFDVFGE